ncbi:hypothetical protein EIP86_006438 [Pleurotus ostreatoroseus]|nr:hypothetical protein EIP86_006438 [Pleurotus ostreatoroseus]
MSPGQKSRHPNLPEEILREILYYNLYLPFKTFASVAFSARRNGQMTLFETMSKTQRSRGKLVATSPVNFLLVCKQWLRISTPLLYEGIVITESRQLVALADALRQTPQLGRHIRRLNVLGGYGKEFLDVITHSPNLHTLGLTMDINSSASMKGLVAALPQANPKCFILSTIYYPQNKNVSLAQDTLELAIPQWTSLVRRPIIIERSERFTTLL